MTDYPGDHPEPHADLSSRQPRLVELPAGGLLYRFHGRTREPLHFGRTGKNRFDAPLRDYGVLYAAADAHGAFIETFGQETGVRLLSKAFLVERVLAELKLLRPLRLIDLAGPNSLARIGADGRLCCGSHAVAQRWSAALRGHGSKPGGLVYPARHDAARNVYAVFEGSAEFVIRSKGSLMESANKRLLTALLNDYDFGLT